MRKLMAVSSLVAVLVPACALASSLVVNGDFGRDNFSGWRLSGDNRFSQVAREAVFGHMQEVALLGPSGGRGDLSQVLPTLAGQRYQLSFDMRSPVAGPFESMRVSVNGRVVLNSHDHAFGWTHFNVLLPAAGPGSLLSFSYRNDPAFFHLSNVSVLPVPEPESVALLGLGLVGVILARRRGVLHSQGRGR